MHMKRHKLITTITVVLGVLLLVCLAGYYLALHDIFHDYVSPKVLQEQADLTSGQVPEWTACPLEWRIIAIGFWPMLIFHTIFLTSLAWHTKKLTDGMPNRAFEATS
jgi:hypothetical protein